MALYFKIYMSVFALSDPHLSFGVPNKSMDVFGPLWENYTNKMEQSWRELITDKDLVLIPGDISWATHLEDAIPDLMWIDSLPGTKVILKGNHDFWWGSSRKMAKVMPPSIHFIYNSVFNWQDITIGGSRLWDTEEYNFNAFVHFQENAREKKKEPHTEGPQQKEEDRKIFARELERLALSLKNLNPNANKRIALTHYPPISSDLRPSRASAILEEYKIDICVFGHLHSLKKNIPMFGEVRGIRYILASCDYLDFIPLKIL